MTTENTTLTLCRLLGAWVNGAAPELEETPDYEALFQAAERHFLSAAVCAALESTGLMADCPPETARRFRAAKLSAVRRTLLMDAERGEILAALEERGIWYAPLKGVVINADYPQYGTRQFADNDILFDAERWRDVRSIMKRRGYQAKSVGKGSHDTYRKEPIYNFEMHRTLFVGDGKGDFLDACEAYYADARERMIRDSGGFSYHFGDEDLYVYLIAHAFKHFREGGTGLRTLLDVYLCRRARPAMDRRCVAAGLDKLGLTEFEAVLRSLTEKLLGPAPCPELSEKERDMLDWVVSSGVYGTAAHRVQAKLRRLQNGDGPVTTQTKAKYLLSRIFPDWGWYRTNAPFVYSHRWALPFYFVRRLCRGVFIKGRRVLREVSEVCARHEQ